MVIIIRIISTLWISFILVIGMVIFLKYQGSLEIESEDLQEHIDHMRTAPEVVVVSAITLAVFILILPAIIAMWIWR